MKLIPFRCPPGYILRLYEIGLEEVEPISFQTGQARCGSRLWSGWRILIRSSAS
jgi:hypothetical protein